MYIAPDSGEPVEKKESVKAVAARGLEGDRYFEERGLWNILDEHEGTHQASEITFIELETLEQIATGYGIEFEPGAHRRNIVTRDVALNHLVDESFEVGGAVCEGVGLCEPCGYLQSMTGEDELTDALTHRGGLDARILESGAITEGDLIQW